MRMADGTPRHVSSSGESSDSPLAPEDVHVEVEDQGEENLPEYFARTYGWGSASSEDEQILVIDSGNESADVDPSFTTLTERTKTSVHKPLKLATPPDLFFWHSWCHWCCLPNYRVVS